MSNDYFLKIHGHSCLEVRVNETAIIFDPWLVGSAYWRSWWNFPEPSSFETLTKSLSNCHEIFIYITHLHWDHFHGPTLRKLQKEIPKLKFLISRTPERRLKNDLLEVLKKGTNVVEINHGANYIINTNLSLKPFLSGPILTDSAVLIKKNNDFILNLNDSKQQSLMMSQIINAVGDGNLKVMLRSHSSANSRVCLKNKDGSKMINNDKDKKSYSIEFLNAASFIKPKLAIPFASNMCYLHKDSIKYNQHSNTSDLLYKYHLSSKKYSAINLQLVLPGEKIDLNTFKISQNKISRNQLLSNRKGEINKYRDKYINKLKKAEASQENCQFSNRNAINYFKDIFAKLPIFIRIFSRGKIAFIEKKYNNQQPNYFVVDMFKKKLTFNQPDINECHTIIKVSPGVLNNAFANRNLNSLGISKLLSIQTTSIKQYNLFFSLCISAEIGSLPFISIKQFFRSLSIWIRRWREVLNYILIILSLEKIK